MEITLDRKDDERIVGSGDHREVHVFARPR
jgi:hypothetical protein